MAANLLDRKLMPGLVQPRDGGIVEHHSALAGPFRLLKTVLPRAPIRLVDVGAFRGDFTAAVLASFPGSSAVLFEPGPAKAEALVRRFAGERVHVFPHALGDQPAEGCLHEMADPATDSLLAPVAESPRSTRRVHVDRLDTVLAQLDWDDVHLLKTDAQGHDLRVLHGAAETLARARPVLLVEVIFVPLYQQQATFEEMLAFLDDAGYSIAGFHAVHTDARGLLAFADVLLLPRELHAKVASAAGAPFVCRDPDELADRVVSLQKACDERLALIHELTRAADERLALIQRLDAELHGRAEKP